MANLILGIDEVGRGPIAGPLVIGVCILSPRYLKNGRPDPREDWQDELTDSKALTEKRREKMDTIIREKALAYGLGWVPAEELDILGISEGLRVAARRAVEDLIKNFPDAKFSEIIIDGITNFLTGTPYARQVTTIIKADLKIKEVSAASIIAKVARDHYMISVAGMRYPKYEFARHKGYGTKAHWQKLDKNGPCPEHRWLIARISKKYPTRIGEKITSDEPKTTPNPTAVGKTAEQKIAAYLVEQNHKILSRNFRRKNCEIDIVSATSKHIYFTEVKYRSNSRSGSPADAITTRKLKQMHFSATIFMKELSRQLGRSLDDLPSPILAVGTVTKDGTLDWFIIPED